MGWGDGACFTTGICLQDVSVSMKDLSYHLMTSSGKDIKLQVTEVKSAWVQSFYTLPLDLML